MEESRGGAGRPRKVRVESPSRELGVVADTIGRYVVAAIRDLPSALAQFGLKQIDLETPTHHIGVEYGYTDDGRRIVEVSCFVGWRVRQHAKPKGGVHAEGSRDGGSDPGLAEGAWTHPAEPIRPDGPRDDLA